MSQSDGGDKKFGFRYSKSEVGQTIPQSATLTAPFAQGSHGGGVRLALLPFVQGSHDVGRGTKPTPFMPPFMVRGSVALTNHASPYGKGRCHKVTEGIKEVGFRYSKSEVGQTIPQSAMRQTAPFAQGSHGWGMAWLRHFRFL